MIKNSKTNLIVTCNALLLLLLLISQQIHSQTLTSTLPIVIIETNNKENVVDFTKITASMKIINNGSLNKESNLPNEYNGYIGIEYRGSSSQSFPKKAYSIETRNVDGSDNDQSIFGWPKESDWVLYASYNEKSLMHNVFAMELSKRLGMYASRTKYVEVKLNGEYLGVYVFMEKIKVAKGRVDIAKLNETDVSGDELSGGYIVKIDKFTGANHGGWVSPILTSTFPNRQVFFQFDAPKSINDQQKNYIQNYVEKFEVALKGAGFMDSVSGYRKYAEYKSFIHYFILNEISRNIDGYRLSTYLYKDKDSKNGKLAIGPPWDYDIAFGNADYCQGNRYDLWGYKFNEICPDDGFHVPFWWARLLQDSFFVKELRKEYDGLRKNGILKTSNLHAMVDSLQQVLQVPQQRNFNQWPIIGQYVWPSPDPIPSTWQGEVNELKTWLSNRMAWLDDNLPKVKASPTQEYKGLAKLNIYPNPSKQTATIELYIDQNRLVVWQLFNSTGTMVYDFKKFHTEGRNVLELDSNNFGGKLEEPQIYFLKAIIGNEVLTTKIVRL